MIIEKDLGNGDVELSSDTNPLKDIRTFNVYNRPVRVQKWLKDYFYEDHYKDAYGNYS